MGESGNSYLFISQPMMPKATQTPTSKAFLLMEKAPSREMTRMMGYSIFFSTETILAKKRTPRQPTASIQRFASIRAANTR